MKKATPIRLALVGAALGASPLVAQTGAAPAPGADAAAPATSDAAANTGGVGEIIVTAQKRAQRLQDVPITISAFSAETVQQRGLDNLSRLSSAVPSVQISQFSNQKPQLYIRGIGTRQLGPGTDQSVGVFVDDFYAGDASALFTSLTDVERIETLKGPQGTLYGRNTIGGAISITTKAPTSKPEIQAEASTGNYGYMNGKASLSGPIAGDTVLGRISGYVAKRDGYMRNTLIGGQGGLGLDQWGTRAKLLFHIAPDLTATVTADYNRDTSPGQLGRRRGPGTFMKATNIPNPPVSDDPFHAAANINPTSDATNWGTNARIEWSPAPLTITSLTQYRHNKFHNIQELDGTALDIVTQDGRQNGHNFSQELRFSSTPNGVMTLGNKLDWMVGMFYYHSDVTANDAFIFGPQSFPYQLVRRSTTSTSISTVNNHSYAAYLDTTYHITDTLSITGGIRYSHDKKTGMQIGLNTQPGVPSIVVPFSVPVEFKAHSVDPKATLSWKPRNGFMAYFTYSQGYKSGGFQYLASSAALGSNVFGPEHVDYYEAGVKTQWLDRKLTLNVAGFYGDYRGFQLQRLVGSSAFTDAAATVRLKGIELNGHLQATTALSFDFAYAYLDNKFKHYNQCATAVALNCAILDGTRLPRSPKHQVNLGGQYVLPLGEKQDLTFRADWVYRSKSILEAGGDGAFVPGTGQVATLNPFFKEPSNNVLDLRLTYHRGPVSIAAWATNVTNETYSIAFANFTPLPTAAGEIGNEFLNYYAPPRMYGITVGFKY